MNQKIIQIIVISLTIVAVFSLFMCTWNEPPVVHYGNLTVRFQLEGNAPPSTRSFDQVAGGTVFLIQEGTTIVEGELTIDLAAMTGECELTNVRVGNYDILIELYDSTSTILYSGSGRVYVTQGNNDPVTIDLSPHTGSLVFTGNWTETIPGLDSANAFAQLSRENEEKYARNLTLSTGDREISGNFPSIIYPGEYELHAVIEDTEENMLFEGTHLITIESGENTAHLTLEVKTGSIQIQVNGDLAPPVVSDIAVSPNGVETTITWTTDEPATSNVCYSETPDFDYTTTRTWAPLAGDLTADNMAHSVTITGLDESTTYYYVIVTTDAKGNLTVSDEGRWPLEPEILFYSDSDDDGFSEIYSLQIDGTGRTLIWDGADENVSPRYFRWSPDKTKIALGVRTDSYTKLALINSDGTGYTVLYDDSDDNVCG
jgi:hypothetical protein